MENLEGPSPRSATIVELLSRAKAAIEAGEASLRIAADDLAAAQEQGATQRQIAEGVGKSAAWVNALLEVDPIRGTAVAGLLVGFSAVPIS